VGEDGSQVWVGVASTDGVGRAAGSAGGGASLGLEMLQDVVMELSAELGRTRMTVRDLLSLQPGNVVELDRLAGSPADLLVNGRLVARGEVVVVDEDYAVKITELVRGGDAV
jgi:flagellar motor switch protein FliN/FliY